MTTLENSFHGTTVRIAKHWGDQAERLQMTVYDLLVHQANDLGNESAKRTLRKVRRTLCGMTNCRCGTVR